MVVGLALLAAAQATPVPVPPAPPPLRSGTIRCDVLDRSGGRAELTGTLGNWRRLPNGIKVADLDMQISGESERLPRVTVTIDGLRGEFSQYDSDSRTQLTGHLTVTYTPEGWILLERDVFGTTRTQMGFCETHFTVAAGSLPQ